MGKSGRLLEKVVRGVSCQKYAETVVDAAKAFGVSASSVSRHIIEATAKQLEEFKERSLSSHTPFAIFLDTIHRGGEAFIIALGVDTSGDKQALGFWQGATENHEICEELFSDMERRGVGLSPKGFLGTEGGQGGVQALRGGVGGE